MPPLPATPARTLIVLPAFNAARTLEATLAEIPADFDHALLLVDDGSTDDTVALARKLGIEVLCHERNRGYGANQKTCYAQAMARDMEVVIMLHPDHQYDASVLPELRRTLLETPADIVLGSRTLQRDPRRSGMPAWRFWGNRLLTTCQNRILHLHLSEYHTGLRAFRVSALRQLPLERFSDDFVFDQQILIAAARQGLRIAEVSAACRYFPEASSISFRRSVRYGLLTLWSLVERSR